jgi:hypothetical protein
MHDIDNYQLVFNWYEKSIVGYYTIIVVTGSVVMWTYEPIL